MISEIRPLYVGNALQVALRPPAGALLWRVLRNGTGVFAGEADASALVAYEGTDTTFVDAEPGLTNELPAFYGAFYWNGTVWAASAVASGTPRATYTDESTDALRLVRDRLEAGLKVEIDRGVLKPGDRSYIQVLTAPPSVDAVEPPVVTVHLESDGSGARALGEVLTSDVRDAISGVWVEHDGWLDNFSLEIIGWSLNPDERSDLRRALRRLIVANLPVFDAAGMVEISFTQRDAEFLNGEFGANVYQTVGTLSGQAPILVTNRVAPITDVEVGVVVDGEVIQT